MEKRFETSGKVINCPKCGRELEVDSVRKHRDGRERVYWECADCNVSMMDRGI